MREVKEDLVPQESGSTGIFSQLTYKETALLVVPLSQCSQEVKALLPSAAALGPAWFMSVWLPLLLTEPGKRM